MLGININAQQFIFAAKDFTIVLTLGNGLSFPLLTTDAVSFKRTKEVEEVFAIGQQDPIAIMSKSRKLAGSLTVQAGELNTILTAGGYKDATEIEGATLSIVAVKAENPLPFGRILSNVNFNEESLDLKKSDSQSLISLPFVALSAGIA